MRARLVLLVGATTSLVLVAFLVPLSVLVRTAAADHAITAADAQMQAVAPLVATVDADALDLAVSRANSDSPHLITVFLPDGRVVGAPADRSTAVDLAATGRSFTAVVPGGREILLAVGGLADGTAVIRTFIADAELNRGVGRARGVLVVLGVGLLAMSMLVAYQLGRTITGPLTAVAEVSHRLARGDLVARAAPAGPPEVRQVSAGLNRLATRISELLAAERELVADLSHRLRTPLTALRIDAESLSDPVDRARIGADLDAVDRTLNAVILEARRPVREAVEARCDASAVVAERVAFWSALAEEEKRQVGVELAAGPVPVRVSAPDLAVCVDALLANVFAHTPEGCAMAVRLERHHNGSALLVVSDHGPGLPDAGVLERGRSAGGSTGLGLDIVRRLADASGGALHLGGTPGGGATIAVRFGSG
jgi:signal transduction histidine kinase